MNDGRYFGPVNFHTSQNLLAALLVCLAAFYSGGAADAKAAEFLVGAATTSITPDKPVALSGQFHTRVAKKVESPVTATALALESRDGDKVLDQAIMVSCDLVAIRKDIQARFRERVKSRLPGFDVRKLFLSATHTHTGPVMVEGNYVVPKEGVMQPAEYGEGRLARLGEVGGKAWEGRKPGGVSWGLGHAVVAINRRVVYANGTAQMYGKTNRPDFRSIEGYEDHGIGVLFFWNAQKKLIAMAVNVACPSQEVEGRSAVNADFWHAPRELLRKQYGKDLCVLGWCGAAGDQSPHLMYNRAAEERMRKLRGLTRLEELARRIARAVDEAFEVAKNDIRTDVPLVHKVEDIKLPVRMVTDKERAAAKAQVEALSKNQRYRRKQLWYQKTIDRYANQKDKPDYDMELHVIRLGDVAICTNPFELFTDYGIRIKARSKAVQTFVIQLAGAINGYLPTEKAVKGGGYSAVVESSRVGPKGGQVLVEETVETINSLWPTPEKK